VMAHAAARRPCLSMRVRDAGVGIAPGNLPHRFEPFNRLAQATFRAALLRSSRRRAAYNR